MRNIVIYDFDGTVTTGTSQYIRCADLIAEELGGRDAEKFTEEIKDSFSGKIAFDGEDGWDLVDRISKKYSDQALFTKAFHTTRKEMLSQISESVLSNSVIELLEEIHPLCVTALASNSPREYVNDYIEKFYLTKHFDYIRYGAHKPVGIIDLGLFLMKETRYDDARILSIGDHYVNDVEPAVKMGWEGAYINPFNLDSRRATVTGRTITDLYDWILSWCKT